MPAENIVLPTSVKEIDYDAFANSELKSITIPENVQNISFEVFKGCKNFKDIYYGGSKQGWLKIRKLHDQMGAGLAAIRQSLTQENADDKEAVRLLRQAVNAIWNDNQYPLEEGDFERFLQDAKTLGVEVVCEGDLPESEELASICILAMRECLTNGVCHAGATELSIQMQNENHQYSICITNNGAAPDKEIIPKGGLYNISRHVFDYGGEMRIQSFPYFALTITFQEERA